MSLYKTLIAVGLLFGVSNYAFSEADFTNTHHNFGEVPEEEGSVEHDFTFTNTASETLTIERVTTSCGCTSPDFSQEVAPGEEGYVTAAYNPSGREGSFTHYVYVHTDQSEQRKRLAIDGTVLPEDRDTSAEELQEDSADEQAQEEESIDPATLDREIGNIATARSDIFLGEVASNDETATGSIPMKNTSDETITIEEYDGPEYIIFSSLPDKIGAGVTKEVPFVYDASQNEEYGRTSDIIALFSDEGTDDRKRFRINADISPHVDEDDPASHPKAHLDRNEHDFGEVRLGEKLETEFTIRNEGEGILEIERLLSGCNCTASKAGDKIVMPGQSSNIRVILDTSEQGGEITETTEIMTNDPENPIHKVEVAAEVVFE